MISNLYHIQQPILNTKRHTRSTYPSELKGWCVLDAWVDWCGEYFLKFKLWEATLNASVLVLLALLFKAAAATEYAGRPLLLLLLSELSNMFNSSGVLLVHILLDLCPEALDEAMRWQ